MLALCAECTTYTGIELDQQAAEATGGEGPISSITSADSTGGTDSSADTASATTAPTVGTIAGDGSGGDGTGSGGSSSDAPSSGGSSMDSSGGAGSTGPSSGGVAATDSSQASTGGTGGSIASGGAGGVGSGGSGGVGTGGAGGVGSGGSGGTGGVGGDSGSGGVSGTGGTGGTSPTTTFRYARLVALTSQNGNPWTAMAEFDLLDGSGQPIDRSGWIASADSEETVDEPGYASNAIDGDTNTYWHTEWGDYDAPLPHYLQIDLGSAQEITGFVYTPRQGGIQNGWILDWEFYLSNSASDPGSAVDSGSFPSGQAVQTVNLP